MSARLRTPLVTVGIPFLDEERLLGRAIRSILRQTMGDLELLLVDDGSRDRSLEVARSFDDPRIRVLADGTRRHLARRLNQITDEARGQFVARMDADDVAHPERLARQLARLGGPGGFAACGTWAGLVDDAGEAFGVLEAARQPLSDRQVLMHGVLPHPTLVAARSWFLEHRYDESLTRTEDRDLWCRSASTTAFAVIEERPSIRRERDQIRAISSGSQTT